MKFMKFFPLIFLAPALLMTGCSQRGQQAPSQVTLSASDSEVPQGTITLSTTLIRVKKKNNIAWKDVLSEWGPDKMVLIFQGDGSAVQERIAARSAVSIEYMSTGSTPNYTPMPVSVHRAANDGGARGDTGVDLTVLPAYRNLNGPITLMASLNIKDERGRFSAHQFMSLHQGQSLLISRVLDKDTQQVVIITPQIDHLSLPL